MSKKTDTHFGSGELPDMSGITGDEVDDLFGGVENKTVFAYVDRVLGTVSVSSLPLEPGDPVEKPDEVDASK